ncbi:hypothetical protein JOC37_002351 [Desulfohalotomaculum tongense]|uniref:hypothetical protein n=1 Tax=Desulforadius tongensis TaxID=1216062 RepID=UPI001959B8AC|nr:hypothetical protein [Desulforadius tongensis]MBM7855928.1 hypothetical protein [Desulforadius tongensis]
MEFLFFVFIAGMIYFLVQRKRKLSFKSEQMEKNLFKKQLQSSALSGIAGGLAAMFLINQIQNNNHLDQETIEKMQDMDLNELQEFALQNDLMQQQELNELVNYMQDPYQNPGMDGVIDEYYHGLDRGLGYADAGYFDSGMGNGLDAGLGMDSDFGLDDYFGGMDDF